MEGINKQVIGNAGLFYICYELSKRGWNCLPTTRNAKGVDIVIYSQDAKKSYTIQVKALRYRNAVPFGSNLQIIADFVIIVRYVLDKPEVFIMKSNEVKERLHKRVKGNKISYWLQIKEYSFIFSTSILLI